MAQTCCGGGAASRAADREHHGRYPFRDTVLLLCSPCQLVATAGAHRCDRHCGQQLACTVSPTCYVCGPTSFVERVAELLITSGHRPERFGASGNRPQHDRRTRAVSAKWHVRSALALPHRQHGREVRPETVGGEQLSGAVRIRARTVAPG